MAPVWFQLELATTDGNRNRAAIAMSSQPKQIDEFAHQCGRWRENRLQAVLQGVVAGPIAIYLFARSVYLLGVGRIRSAHTKSERWRGADKLNIHQTGAIVVSPINCKTVVA
jgi:hypothetical protein